MGVMAELVNKAGMSNLVHGSFSMKWSRAGTRYEFQPSLSPAMAEVSRVWVSKGFLDKYIWNKDTIYNTYTFQASITELVNCSIIPHIY